MSRVSFSCILVLESNCKDRAYFAFDGHLILAEQSHRRGYKDGDYTCESYDEMRGLQRFDIFHDTKMCTKF